MTLPRRGWNLPQEGKSKEGLIQSLGWLGEKIFRPDCSQISQAKCPEGKSRRISRKLQASWRKNGRPDAEADLLMWQLNIATLIRFFTAVLLAPCGATAKHGNYYSGKFMFFKLEKKYLLAGVIISAFLSQHRANRKEIEVRNL